MKTHGGHAALVDGPWKLHLNPKSDKGVMSKRKKGEAVPTYAPIELYHLDNDPGETTNIAEQHPDIVQRLQPILQAWQVDVGNDPGRKN